MYLPAFFWSWYTTPRLSVNHNLLARKIQFFGIIFLLTIFNASSTMEHRIISPLIWSKQNRVHQHYYSRNIVHVYLKVNFTANPKPNLKSHIPRISHVILKTRKRLNLNACIERICHLPKHFVVKYNAKNIKFWIPLF